MFFLIILIALPSYVAFRRGHNGYLITVILLGSYVFSVILSYTPFVIFGASQFLAIWLVTVCYVLFSRGDEGDPFKELETNSAVGDLDEIDESVDVSDDEWVLLKSYMSQSQQTELYSDLQKLESNNIMFSSKGGAMASVYVYASDFDRAATIVGLESAN